MEYIVYKITSPKGKIYIGRTKDFDGRMAQHKYEATTLRRDYPLYRAIRKYGWDLFTKEIIATCPTEEMSQLSEEALIRQFDSVNKGYNATYNTTGGGNQWKGKTEDELNLFRTKMARVTAGDKNGMFGKQHSEEAKSKQKEKAKGRFSLQWYIDRNGQEEGTKLYNQRSENLRARNLARNSKGRFGV